MIISEEKEVIFVWIPHTAGTSMMKFLEKEISEDLNQIEGVHSDPSDLNLSDYKNYTFFCTIRNHWDWVLSFWSYERRLDFLQEDVDIATDSFNFNKFVENSIKGHFDKGYGWTRGYFDWTGYKMKYIDCYIVMNRERFLGVKNVVDELGIDLNNIEFPLENQSNKTSRESVYTDRSKEMVYDYLSEEIDYFGFEF